MDTLFGLVPTGIGILLAALWGALAFFGHGVSRSRFRLLCCAMFVICSSAYLGVEGSSFGGLLGDKLHAFTAHAGSVLSALLGFALLLATIASMLLATDWLGLHLFWRSGRAMASPALAASGALAAALPPAVERLRPRASRSSAATAVLEPETGADDEPLAPVPDASEGRQGDHGQGDDGIDAIAMRGDESDGEVGTDGDANVEADGDANVEADGDADANPDPNHWGVRSAIDQALSGADEKGDAEAQRFDWSRLRKPASDAPRAVDNLGGAAAVVAEVEAVAPPHAEAAVDDQVAGADERSVTVDAFARSADRDVATATAPAAVLAEGSMMAEGSIAEASIAEASIAEASIVEDLVELKRRPKEDDEEEEEKEEDDDAGDEDEVEDDEDEDEDEDDEDEDADEDYEEEDFDEEFEDDEELDEEVDDEDLDDEKDDDEEEEEDEDEEDEEEDEEEEYDDDYEEEEDDDEEEEEEEAEDDYMTAAAPDQAVTSVSGVATLPDNADVPMAAPAPTAVSNEVSAEPASGPETTATADGHLQTIESATAPEASTGASPATAEALVESSVSAAAPSAIAAESAIAPRAPAVSSSPLPEDAAFERAVELVLDRGKATISLLQEALAVRYFEAAKLLDRLEHEGIIGQYSGALARPVLISRESWKERRRASS